jgi:GNAT superfamily N-acetyltransferase
MASASTSALFVDSHFQRMGLSSRLLGQAVSAAASLFPGATVRATLRDGDDASLEWAERHGFAAYARSISMSQEPRRQKPGNEPA